MKKLLFIIGVVMELSLIGCQEKSVTTWSDQEIDTWFKSSAWNNELSMQADESINIRLFVEQNVLNPKSWEAAYKFLRESDFNKMDLGRYELADDGTYANIEEYVTKDSSHFEAHRQYIDIQYLAHGQEYIYITPVEHEDSQQITPYNVSKDIEFFDKDSHTKHLLSSTNFLVLFPSDGHKPCMKVDSNEKVRKVVVKIPVIEKFIQKKS
jgi:YhcH/YjgK/YiaL family protein